ncbi:MAG: Pr6Pr family membrane protein [Candidatus Dormibacteraeota bacterium]|nr:Pr6Pr family membrane protein [Candidatus Dormibacteraeota bacterium]
MSRLQIIGGCRALFAGLTLVAIATQMVDLAGKGILSPVNYFSYFTIDSNLIAVAVLFAGAMTTRSGAGSRRLDVVRGGVVVYMSITGIVFTLLLSNTDVDTAIPWVNTVVHELMPLVILADWLLVPPTARLSMGQGVFWLSFPLMWIVYTLIRGAIVNHYPYPFLNPANGGYASVSAYCVGILVAMLIVCLLTVILGNAAAGRGRRAEPA